MWIRWTAASLLVGTSAIAQSGSLLDAVRLHSKDASAMAVRELAACEQATPPCADLGRLSLLAGYLALSDGDAAQAYALLSKHEAPEGLEPWHAYYLGQAAFYQRDHAEAAKHFARALERAPASLKVRATARLGEAHLAAGNAAAAIKHLEAAATAHGTPELYFQRAVARAAVGNLGGARADWLHLAVRHPAHPVTQDALERLGAPKKSLRFTFQERLTRARGFLNAGQTDDALEELAAIEAGKLAKGATAKAQLALAQAQALYAAGRDEEADGWLDKAMKGPERLAAEAAMLRARRALKRSDRALARRLMAEVARRYPKDPVADDALFLAGWLDLQEGRFADAVKTFQQFEKAHPGSRRLDETLWYRALAHLRLDQHAKTRAALEALMTRFPRSSLVPQARYWSARSAQLSGAAADEVAREYEALVARFPGTFYALLAQVRLRELGRSPPPAFPERPAKLEGKVPEALTRAVALTRTGLFRDASEEVAAQLSRVQNPADALRFGHALQQLGEYGSAYALAARHLWGRAYTGKEPQAVALLYPLAYREAVEREAARQKIPAWLVWAIMRRESAFRPGVASPADARGLMQIIPPTAAAIARALGDEPPPPDALFAPAVNIRYGAWYLAQLWERFSHPALAAAAYNAGPPAVLRWVEANRALPLDLFVELIPFKETRAYVKQVVADFHLYQALYGEGPAVDSLALTLPEPRADGVSF